MNTKYIIRAIKSVESAKQKIEQMNKKYPLRYKDELEDVGNTVVAKWYASYHAYYYRSKESLFDAFKVILHGTDYSVEFDYTFMNTHGEIDEYIFENSFIQGYHGGADKDKNGKHPHPGIPYWRTPFPTFKSWGRPALRSFSPYNQMVAKMNKTIKQIDRDKQNEYDKIIDRVNNSISKIL